ncbi:MAG: TonB family protein [Terracidiphilus sp.]
MSRNAEVSTSIQDPSSPELTGSARMTVAVIGPNAAHRKVVSKALAGSETRAVREFIDYPAKLTDIQRLMEQQRFDVVMIDVDSDQSYALQVVQKFAAIENVMVMVYSMRNDQALLRSCLEAGARDFLPLPAEAVAEAERSLPPAPPDSVRPPQAPIPVQSASVEAARPIAPPDILKIPAPPAPEAPRPVPFAELVRPAPSPMPDILKSPAPDPQRPVPPVADFGRQAPAPMPDILKATPSNVQEITKAPSSAVESFYRAPMDLPESSRSLDLSARPAGLPSSELRTSPAAYDFSTSIEPPAVLRPQPVAPPANAPASDPTAADFAAWDNAWIRAAQPAAGNATESKRPGDMPTAKAKTGRLLGATPKTAPAPLPVEKAQPAEVPTFRAVDSSETASQGPDWKKWGLIAAVPVVLVVIGSLIFMRPSHPAATVEPQAQAPVQESSAVNTTTPAPSAPVTAKPSPAAMAVTPSPETSAPVRTVSPAMMDAQLSAPSRIAGTMKKPVSIEEAPPSGFTTGGIDGGAAMPSAVFGNQEKVRIVPGVSAISAGVAEGMLLHKTSPVYPQFAKEAHMSGTVVLAANITPSGMIEGLHVISGPEVFRGPALDAVRTWRYRPYKLNNQPVEVQTTIRLIFSLDQR